MAEKEERRIEEIEKLKEIGGDYTSGTAVPPPDLVSDVRDTIPPPPPPPDPPSPKPEDKGD